MEKYIKATFDGFIGKDVSVSTKHTQMDKAEHAMCVLAVIEDFIESEEDLALLTYQAHERFLKRKEK